MSGSQLHPVQSDSVRLQSSAGDIEGPMVRLPAAKLQAYQRLDLKPDTVRSPDVRADAGGDGILGATEEVSEVKSSDQDSATWVTRGGVGRIQEAADDHEVGEISVAQHVLLRPQNQPYATTALSSTETSLAYLVLHESALVLNALFQESLGLLQSPSLCHGSSINSGSDSVLQSAS